MDRQTLASNAANQGSTVQLFLACLARALAVIAGISWLHGLLVAAASLLEMSAELIRTVQTRLAVLPAHCAIRQRASVTRFAVMERCRLRMMMARMSSVILLEARASFPMEAMASVIVIVVVLRVFAVTARLTGLLRIAILLVLRAA
jgi:hypothetical protein